MTGIVTVIFAIGIPGLFWLDRDEKARTSIALWIPWLWISIACSRAVSAWLGGGHGGITVEAVMEGSPIDRAVFMGLQAVGLIVLASRGKSIRQLFRSPGIQVVLFYFAYCLLSIVWSEYPAVAIKRWIKAMGDFEMILIVLSDPQPLAALKRLFSRMSFVLIPLSILFIKYYPEIGMEWGPWGGTGSYGGVTTNKNTLGVVCLCLGLASLWRFLDSFQEDQNAGRKRRMLAHGAILAMVIWLFVIANSVTSETTFVMAGTLLVALQLRLVRRPVFVHSIIISMLAISASIVFLGVSPSALASLGRNPTLTDRTEVWGWIFSLVRNPLLGTGFESFWLGWRLQKLWDIYWWHPNEAHNGYIEIYANLGWMGIALLALILIIGYQTVLRAWRYDSSLGGLRMAYFLVALVYNYTEAALFKMQAPAWLFFLIALSIPGIVHQKIEPSSNNPVQYPEPLGWESTFAAPPESVI